jgi:hypothetical protein
VATKKKNFTVALAGNPNCGKTSVFNALTGAKAHVGNYPGVTVEKRSARVAADDLDIEYVDLPGVYSLSAITLDESAARYETVMRAYWPTRISWSFAGPGPLAVHAVRCDDWRCRTPRAQRADPESSLETCLWPATPGSPFRLTGSSCPAWPMGRRQPLAAAATKLYPCCLVELPHGARRGARLSAGQVHHGAREEASTPRTVERAQEASK